MSVMWGCLKCGDENIEAMESEIERLTTENAALRKDFAQLSDGSMAVSVRQQAENAALREALESIAKNTCCDKCQEAALVARKALAP